MINKIIKQVVQWLFGLLIGFFIVNIICFGYARQPGWYDTPSGASEAVREPNSIIVHGTEGFSVSRVDENGFPNPKKQLSDDYILMMGASHTFAKHVDPNNKYSVLVNEYLGENDDFLYTYNIACDGSFLPSQIKHFKAALQAFPESQLITIEIMSTDYSIKELEDALNQPDYKEDDSAVHFSKLSTVGKVKNWVKGNIPMISHIKTNISTIKKAGAEKTEFQVDEKKYDKAINEALSLIRSEYDKPILFIYHPGTIIEEDGNISLKYSKTWDVFKNACSKNGIDYIDSGNDFIEYYNEYKQLPYGFANTTLGSGHLNNVGHRIIADEIIEYLKEIEQ